MFIKPLFVPGMHQLKNETNLDPKNPHHVADSPALRQGNEQIAAMKVRPTIKGEQLDFQQFAKDEEDVFKRQRSERRRRRQSRETEKEIDTLI